MRKTAASLALCLLLSMPDLVMAQAHSYLPEQGFVPDEHVAVAIAEAIVTRIYGPEQIKNQKPFTATLSDGIWTVSGTLPETMRGGVFVIKINKKDSKIVSLTHGK